MKALITVHSNWTRLCCLHMAGPFLNIMHHIMMYRYCIAPDKRGILSVFFLFLQENICCGYSLEGPHGEIKYSRTSLSRTRLFWITAYLEVKIWSLFLHETMTTGKKIMWKRGEIAPKEQFLLFSTLFYIYISNFRSQITYSFVKWGCSIYFPHSRNSDMSRYGYLEVFQWVPWNSR